MPYLTDASHYELAACVIHTYCKDTKEDDSDSPVNNCSVQPSVFTLIEDNTEVPEFKIEKEQNYNISSHIGAPYNSIEEGDEHEWHFTFFKPKAYLLKTNLTGLKVVLPKGSNFLCISLIFGRNEMKFWGYCLCLGK